MTALHITARGLEKSYPQPGSLCSAKQVLRGLSFQIAEGERIGVIGRNGAGKTTLLQLISGIGVPTGGVLDINGHVTAIFTLGLGLREDLTGRENIFIDGELQGRSRAATLAVMEETLEFAELGEFIDRPVRTYSTGMKARLAFAMLVHIEPEILIIDEALSVGDTNFARKATAKMRALAQRGKILIVVSHAMGAICDMCTRCLWIDQGTIRMDGTPELVTQAYLEEVRQVDEQVLLQRYRRQMTQESLVPGWDITAMQFHESLGGRPVGTLQTGEPTHLALRIAAPPGAACRVTLEFFRLDQISICISDSAASARDFIADASGTVHVVAELGTLPLNYGIYAARVAVIHQGAVVARRTLFAEVFNPAPHAGGRAMVVTPWQISVEKGTS
ncbi:MAG: ABC transporter ATP-binding protein [Alphaproteobacteria bacterium]